MANRPHSNDWYWDEASVLETAEFKLPRTLFRQTEFQGETQLAEHFHLALWAVGYLGFNAPRPSCLETFFLTGDGLRYGQNIEGKNGDLAGSYIQLYSVERFPELLERLRPVLGPALQELQRQFRDEDSEVWRQTLEHLNLSIGVTTAPLDETRVELLYGGDF